VSVCCEGSFLVELVVAGHPGDGHESGQLEGAVVQGLVSHQFHRLHLKSW
jgi:hypothetical protein